MAVGPGTSYWNKAMKKLCMFISLCMGVWYIQPRLIWFLDRFLGLRTCRMVSGHVEGSWEIELYRPLVAALFCGSCCIVLNDPHPNTHPHNHPGNKLKVG